MKTVSAEILACLQAPCIKSCDLYTLTLADGTVYRFANFDRDVAYGGYTYQHRKFLFKRNQINLQGAPSVDNLSVTVYCTPEDKLGTTPFMQGCHNGLLDQSTMLLSRAYFSEGECVGVVPLFSGRCEVNQSGGLSVKLSIKSIIQGLAAPVPVRMFASQAAYANNNGVITTSSTDTVSMVIPLKPSGNVLLKV